MEGEEEEEVGVCAFVGEKEEATEEDEEEAEDLLQTNKQTSNRFTLSLLLLQKNLTAKSVSCPVIGNAIAPRHIQHPSFQQYP
jgi:hypothetical protein